MLSLSIKSCNLWSLMSFTVVLDSFMNKWTICPMLFNFTNSFIMKEWKSMLKSLLWFSIVMVDFWDKSSTQCLIFAKKSIPINSGWSYYKQFCNLWLKATSSWEGKNNKLLILFKKFTLPTPIMLLFNNSVKLSN